jgi:hypothetical protein
MPFLTKTQQVRQYQLERVRARLEKRSLPRFEKYSPDQPRDERGRWTDTGATRATGAGARRTRARISQEAVNIWDQPSWVVRLRLVPRP